MGPKLENIPHTGNVTPFLKWAGGKRWLVDRFPELFPSRYDRFVEPFLGSGAAFFKFAPKKALLCDINPRLVNAYLAIKEDWRKVARLLREHQRKHSEEHYYLERSRNRRSNYTQAAQLIYLNRTCWNGLYRVNRNGIFNVPKGTKTNVVLDTDDFETVSSLLSTAKIKAQDFETTLNSAKRGDFIFIDPPYTVRHNMNGFVKYNEKIFSWNDQVRLKASIVNAAKSGAKILVTNASHESILDLYDGLGQKFELERHSVLAGQSKYRSKTAEIGIAINYEVNI